MQYEEVLQNIEKHTDNGKRLQEERINALIITLSDSIGRAIRNIDSPNGWEIRLLESLVQSVTQK